MSVALFIAGYGNVAKELLLILADRDDFLLAGISNSTTMSLSLSGIEPLKVNKALENGEPADILSFCQRGSEMQFLNKIFIDCTACEEVASSYTQFAQNGFSVVSCNKIAFCFPAEKWRAMKSSFSSYGKGLLYETTVGAALPVIATIRNMVSAGDRVDRVEAILSGTLNFLLSSYNGGESLDSLILKARELGYTEPDPSVDLSGLDVARKALIISREMGIIRELKDVSCSPLLPGAGFERLYAHSEAKGEKLRYIARVSADVCTTGVESLPADHPLARTESTDNTIIIYSRDYPRSITISGAGAGARQTAAGVFCDILVAAQKIIKT